MQWEFLYFTIFFLLDIINGLKPLDDPYKILGVKKSSTVQELRRAYKKLAKEWHPDKNNDPLAANKFVEITQAYECSCFEKYEYLKYQDVFKYPLMKKIFELLSDPERKKQFDNHGVINPDSNHKRWSEYQFEEFDAFDEIFNFPRGFRFANHNLDISLFHKLAITARAFENNIVARSFSVPHLILFYADWCFLCIKLEPIWRKVIEELEPIGIGIATVHFGEEQTLAKKCGITTVPSLILLIDGKTHLFKESLYSLQKIVDFVRSKFPYKLIVNIKDDNLNNFLEGWHDNRVRALIFESTETIRLRYLLAAFYFNERVSFGFVRLGRTETVKIQSKYKVSSEVDTLLIFNENVERPVASLSMTVIPVQTMKDVIAANKYLILPRLSSQKVMDSVCPIEWARRRKRLCVVLISENSKMHDESRQAMRQLAQESSYNSERVRFSYIYQERQKDFINSLLLGSPEKTVLNIVILWRRDAYNIKYEWIQGSITFNKKSPAWNKTKEQLEFTIAKLLRNEETLTYSAVVKELIDEQDQGLIGRIISRLLIFVDIFEDLMSKHHVSTTVPVLGTMFFIIAMGYLMAYLMRKEEEKIKRYENKNGCKSKSGISPNRTVNYAPELKLHELRAEKYNGMVRLLKPGCRTIILLLDGQSQNTLLSEFHTIVWPYRKNKTLMFGYMFVEKNLEWYKRLLTLSLPEPRDFVINPRNCIGTVLSLNGHRKYFCMYHAKHPERHKDRKLRRIVKITKTLNSNANVIQKMGNFIGFEDSSDSNSEESIDVEQGSLLLNENKSDDILFQRNLLKSLPIWLDRLFEGTTHRYYINYWPDFPTK